MVQFNLLPDVKLEFYRTQHAKKVVINIAALVSLIAIGLKIDKDQTTILLVTIAATLITVFSLFAIKAMIAKGRYQHRAINAKQNVVEQLKDNLEASKKLTSQYAVFAELDPNILGGNKDGAGSQDGNNSRIILDALPSKYDVPALASSIEKLLSGKNASIKSLAIKDDPASNPDASQAQPSTTPITFSFQTDTNFNGAIALLNDFEKSIRPFDMTSIEISGTDTQLALQVNGQTFFQPAKSLNLSATKVVK
jgi:hypothetical protein